MPFPLEMRRFHPLTFNRSIKNSLNNKDRGNIKLRWQKININKQKSSNLMGMINNCSTYLIYLCKCLLVSCKALQIVQCLLIVLFKQLKNCKRRNIGNYMLKSNSTKIMLCGGVGQHYLVFKKIST